LRLFVALRNEVKTNFLTYKADDNVHFQNTAELNKELVKQGVQYSTMFYANRDHSISGDGEIICLSKNFVFFKRFVSNSINLTLYVLLRGTTASLPFDIQLFGKKFMNMFPLKIIKQMYIYK